MKTAIISLIILLSFCSIQAQESLAPIITTADDSEVFTIVEEMPEFPGGQEALMQFLSTNLVYPDSLKKQAITGAVYVSFIIDAEGNPTEPKILRSPNNAFSDEVVRVISAMPKWKAGKQAGEYVRVRYNLPIRFKLDEPEKTE